MIDEISNGRFIIRPSIVASRTRLASRMMRCNMPTGGQAAGRPHATGGNLFCAACLGPNVPLASDASANALEQTLHAHRRSSPRATIRGPATEQEEPWFDTC